MNPNGLFQIDASMNYNELTTHELLKVNEIWMAARRAVQAEQGRLTEVLDRRLAKEEFARRVGDLAHLLGDAGNIPSGEDVGGLG